MNALKEEYSIDKCSGYVTLIAHTGEFNYDTDEVENGEILSQMTLKNLIVNSSSAILAGAVIPNTNVKITHLGVGIGNNNGKIPSEDVNKTELIHEVRRTKISRSGYIDANGNNTNDRKLIKGCVLKTTLSKLSEFSLVEMGLFGGTDDEAETIGGGIMFNYKTFSTWSISDTASLTVIWRIYF